MIIFAVLSSLAILIIQLIHIQHIKNIVMVLENPQDDYETAALVACLNDRLRWKLKVWIFLKRQFL